MVQTKLIDNEEDQSCKKCPLCQTRNTIVWQRSTVDKDVDVLFIGEAPGKEEDLRGKPFIGKAGKLLDDWIFELDLLSYGISNFLNNDCGELGPNYRAFGQDGFYDRIVKERIEKRSCVGVGDSCSKY